MKSGKCFKRLRNIRWPVLPSTATPFALLLVLAMVSACTTLREDQPKDALYTQIYTDMMYGADDYFGQSMDLSYADGVVPTVVQPVFQTATITPVVIQTAASPRPTTTASASSVATSSSSDSGSSGGSGGGTPAPPPVVTPPPPPPGGG